MSEAYVVFWCTSAAPSARIMPLRSPGNKRFWADLKEGGGLPGRARLDALLREYCRDLARAEAVYGPRLRRLYARVRALLRV